MIDADFNLGDMSLLSPNSSQLASPNDQRSAALPLVSVITPAYNEAVIISQNLEKICVYLDQFREHYRYEVIVVNDGSKDETGPLADAFAATHPHVQVIHHQVNRYLGGALRTGFHHAQGDQIVVLDLDLSYSVDHIERMLAEQAATKADIVVASPYMKGGTCTKVPWFRLLLSKFANRLMRLASPADLHTFTGMVRVYRREFLQQLNLKSNTNSIMPEIIQKALILRGRVIEIPGHLDWSFQEHAVGRQSSMRIARGIMASLMASFIFRPYALFMTVGVLLFLVGAYALGNAMWRAVAIYPEMVVDYTHPINAAIAQVFRARPQLFFFAGICLVLALQFFGIGFLSLQNKRYFDELFHINSNQLRQLTRRK